MAVLMGMSDVLKNPTVFALYRYSRRVLWLKVGMTNNDPKVIALYYLKCVEEVKGDAISSLIDSDWALFCKGTPRLLRSDCGTENVNLAFIQPYLRRNCSDCFAGYESFRYGKSTTNQVLLIIISTYNN